VLQARRGAGERVVAPRRESGAIDELSGSTSRVIESRRGQIVASTTSYSFYRPKALVARVSRCNSACKERDVSAARVRSRSTHVWCSPTESWLSPPRHLAAELLGVELLEERAPPTCRRSDHRRRGASARAASPSVSTIT
jgi:hypothetical protein